MRASWRGVIQLAVLLGALSGARVASANGRFPTAQQVVFGGGAHRGRVTFRVTFGLLVSDDDARTFRWLCEEAMFTPEAPGPAVDPAVEIDAEGRTLFGYGGGVRSWSPDACGVTVLPALAGREVIDLALSADHRTVFGVETTPGVRQWVLRADAADLAFERRGEGVAGVRLSTLDVAPTDSQRVYVGGLDDATRAPVVLQSDDGGATLRRLELPSALVGDETFIAGVHPRDPETFWLRTNIGLGSTLVRVRGGRAEALARSDDAMLGFARAADGETLWYGSVAGGLWRSTDGGDRFTRVSELAVYCLATRGDELWMCGDWLRGPFALGRSTDGGASFQPVLRFEDIAGPVVCAGQGEAGCEARWPVLREDLLRPIRRDAGARDAAGDAAGDAMTHDAPRVDAATTPPLTPRRGCGCSARSAGSAWGWLWVILGWLQLRRICNCPRDRKCFAPSPRRELE